MFRDPQLDNKYGYEECECCEGKGNFGSECCGEPLTDSGLCTGCGEPGELAKCDCCQGTGEVQFDIEERKQEAYEIHLEGMTD